MIEEEGLTPPEPRKRHFDKSTLQLFYLTTLHIHFDVASTLSKMSRFQNRPLDLTYFIFFIWHIPISLCVDFQSIYPQSILSILAHTPLPAFLQWYMRWSRDPIIIGAYSGGWEWDWIRGFMWVEALFQMPCWIIGAWGLWNGTYLLISLVMTEADM
jgi:hypothetical protein